MSFLISVKVPGDVAAFKQALADRSEEFTAIAEKGRAAGAIHHQFGAGDGYIHVIDEWDNPAHFEAFFGSEELQAFVGSVGGDPSAAPDIVVSEALDSADKF
ncbi:MAG TPA: hypothetical protein VHB18_01925 [Mycobacteriales bacterium]|jgi:hypothetical protein|nr:hypothetical protein [Mycobacteriales bacterium]